jgi:hypothetical protein
MLLRMRYSKRNRQYASFTLPTVFITTHLSRVDFVLVWLFLKHYFYDFNIYLVNNGFVTGL